MLEALPRRALLAGLPAAAIGAMAVAGSAVADATDPLILLGVQLETAWRDQVATFDRLHNDMSDAAEAACDAVYKTTMGIAAKIEAARATSLEGLIVKARAVSWCHQGSPFSDVSVFRQYGDSTATTDRRLAATIIRDLISLSGAPLPEMPEEA